MTQVNVTINGRQFRMACEDGEEEHLTQLAEDLDERIARLRAAVRRDRRHPAHRDGGADARRRARRSEREAEAGSSRSWPRLQEARAQSAERTKATQAAVSAALNAAAERIEGITRRLNETVRDDGVAMG